MGKTLSGLPFSLHSGIIETIAHYMAAHYLNKDVSFYPRYRRTGYEGYFVNNGVIDRMEINEACSSGCGSFLETFAKSLGYSAQEFFSGSLPFGSTV